MRGQFTPSDRTKRVEQITGQEIISRHSFGPRSEARSARALI